MILADWIAIGIVVLFAVLGLIAGFSGGLKFFTGGIFGVIISVVVCCFFYGFVVQWEFVNDLLTKLTDAVAAANNAFCDILIKIYIEKIVLFVVMFIIAQIVRIILVKILAGIAEINNPVFKAINKLLGLALMLAVAAMLGLIAFQIIYWIGGSTSTQVADALDGSFFKLDWLYENNPLRTMVDYFRQ